MATKSVSEEITYKWQGSNRHGRVIRGEMNANSPEAVAAHLKRQGVIVDPKKTKKKGKPLRPPKVTTQDISMFFRQLATMMESGVALVQAFKICSRGQKNEGVRKMIDDIAQFVEGGNTMAQALERHPDQFDELSINLVDAGEKAGVLETLLDKIATYKEKSEAMKKKIKKALTYPIAVLAIAFIVTAIIMIFVIPQFESLFQGFGADLPAFTKMVVNMSDYFVNYWYIIFGSIFGVIYGLLKAKQKSRKFCHFLDRTLLRAPIIGAIMENAAVARFSRTLATMSAAGVPLVEAMDSVAGATGNVEFGEATVGIKEEISGGTSLNIAIENAGLFPPMVSQMCAIGEESGNIDDMMAKVAEFYEQEVDNAVDNLSSLIEPMIMAILGVLVGGLVIAMYLPIFKMGGAIGGG